jgi:hypothetical protein
MAIVERDGLGGVFFVTQHKQFLQHSECCYGQSDSEATSSEGEGVRGVFVDSPLPEPQLSRFWIRAVPSGTGVAGAGVDAFGGGANPDPDAALRAGPVKFGSTPNGDA